MYVRVCGALYWRVGKGRRKFHDGAMLGISNAVLTEAQKLPPK